MKCREVFDRGIKFHHYCNTIILMDEVIGHMREKIELPDDYSSVEVVDRVRPTCKPEEYLAYGTTEDNLVPAMADYGSGYRWHVTGLASARRSTAWPRSAARATSSVSSRTIRATVAGSATR